MASKQMTPILRPLRDGSGTIFAFPSAVEDIGLNLDSKANRIALSKFVVLNLPTADTTDENYQKNHFNFTNISGVANLLNNNTSLNIRQKIVVALQDYMMNAETTMINQDDYDYSASATISERVFWKFLKECGAIRWAAVDKNAATLNGKQIYREEAESTETGYTRVVQSIGEISGGNSVSGEFGMYNETYVNIPSTYGGSQVFFEVVEDNNYRLGEVYTSDSGDYLAGRNGASSKETYTLNAPAYDSQDTANAYDREEEICAFEHDSSLPWYQVNDSENNEPYSYFTEEYDPERDGDINYRMDVYQGDNPSTSTYLRSFMRSRLDGVQVVSDIDDIDNIFDQLIEDHPFISYDSINVDQSLIQKTNYEFNAILLYYTIYDKDNNNELATNLFGIVFLNSPSVEAGDAAYNTGDSLKFSLPTFSKIKSNGAGSNTYFGNGYSFKVNIRSLSIYDNTDAFIQDETTGASLYTEDFNDVVFNLNKTVETLQKNTLVLNSVFNDYTKINANVNSLTSKIETLDNKIAELNLRKFTDIQSENIKVNQDFEVYGTSTFNGLFKIDENTNFDVPIFDVSALISASLDTERVSTDIIDASYGSFKDLNSDSITATSLTLVSNSNSTTADNLFTLTKTNELADYTSSILNEVKMIEGSNLSNGNLIISQNEAIEIIKATTVYPYSKKFEIVPTTFDENNEFIQKYKDSLYYSGIEDRGYVNYINYVPIIISVLKKLLGSN